MTELARELDLDSIPDDQALDKLVEENVKAQVRSRSPSREKTHF